MQLVAPRPVTVPTIPVPVVEKREAAATRASVDKGHTLREAAADAGRSLQALPGFLYPAVTGTAAEKAVIFDTLDRLPMHDVATMPAIRVLNNLRLLNLGRDGTMLGGTFGSGDMLLSRTDASGAHMSDDLTRYVVMHEAGHAHDFGGKGIVQALSGRKSNHGPWGDGPFPTSYAATAPPEDFAEGHAFYHLRPDEIARVQNEVGARTTNLEQFSPEKHRAMAESEKLGLLERFVEQKAFRETGRLVGELTSNPVGAALHTGLGMFATFSALSMAVIGGGDVISSIVRKDAAMGVRGGLSLAAGVALSTTGLNPYSGPAALALLGARRGLDTADRLAQANPQAAQGSKTAAAIGGAVGGAVGGVAGPLGGTLAGYAVGGPVGGVIGLVAGSLVGLRGGAELGARAGLALTR